MTTRSIYTIVAVLLLSPLTVNATGYNYNNGKIRSGKIEYSFKINYLDAWDIAGESLSSVQIDSDLSFGFEVGYNYSEHIKFSYEFNYNTPNYTATAVGEDDGVEFVFQDSLNIINSQLNVTYNFSSGNFTPFIGAGIGFAYIDSNISSGFSGDGCYFDPWRGYVCSNYDDSYSAFNLAYNAKIGMRYDLDKSLYLSTAYVQNWYDFSNTKTGTTGQLQFEVGLKY